jgi:NAD+ synthase (glutamine-hydrolysing)
MVMPWNIITRPPSAELRPDQEDSHSLPAYDELDDILSRRIEGAQSRNDIIAAGYPAETVDRILKLMKIAVYKQNQAPPGVKTTARTIRGKDLRLPIANKFNPADPGL